MISETFHPGSFIFGPDSFSKVADVIARQRLKKPLVIADEGIQRSGLSGTLLGMLPPGAELFPGFSGEPTLQLAEKVTEQARLGGYDSVVALGGGSSLDVGKIASIMANNGGHISDYFAAERRSAPLPKVLIPTTAGSGSETSSFAVVRCDDGIKRFMFGRDVVADVAIVDSRLTRSCPKVAAAASGIDAFSTGLEAYMSKLATPFSDAFALDTVELGYKWLEKAVSDRDDAEALDRMSLAASLSGIAASTPAAVNICHCIAETLGPMYGIPHGKAVAAAMPYMVEFNFRASRARLRHLAYRIGLTDERELVPRLKELVKAVGLEGGFRRLGVPHSALQPAGKMIFEHRQHEYGLPQINPAPITLSGLEGLLEETWKGE